MSARFFAMSVVIAALLSGCAHNDFGIISPDVEVADEYADSVKDSDVVVAEAPVGEGYPEPVAAPPVLAESAYGGGVLPVQPAAYDGPPVVPHEVVASQAAADAEGPYRLDTGDRLRIFVYGQPNLSRQYTIDQQGKIAVPLIGEVTARDKTTVALQRAIRDRLGAEFVRDPQVTVDILQNRPFFIYGEVRTAGQYPYVSGMTVEMAIAIAGGFSERANERKFRIKRRINGYIEQIEAPNDYLVMPGDTVYVSERFF